MKKFFLHYFSGISLFSKKNVFFLFTLIVGLWMACFFDLITFLASPYKMYFETNPVFNFLGVGLIGFCLIKILVNVLITYTFLNGFLNVNSKQINSFVCVLIIFSSLIGQFSAGGMNLEATRELDTYKDGLISSGYSVSGAEEKIISVMPSNSEKTKFYIGFVWDKVLKPQFYALCCFLLWLGCGGLTKK